MFIAVVLVLIVVSTATPLNSNLNSPSQAHAGAELPVNDSFAFDGTTSDIARQLYLRHLAGERIDQVIPNTIPAAVTTRLSALNVSYENLPGLLQRALLWDSGFVISPENDAVQVWTLGGRPMANLAVSKVEFDTTGCTALTCSQPDNTMYGSNEKCTGAQMLTAAKCLIDDFESYASSHLAMWSNGGDLNMIPEIRVVTHGWSDSWSNNSYLVYAVHTMSAESEPAYGTCNEGGYGSLVVPCYPMHNTSADVISVMSVPVATPWVTTWIKQYQSNPGIIVNNQLDNDDSGFNLLLLIPILITAIVIAVYGFFAAYKKRRRFQSAYYVRDPSPIESESAEDGQKSKPSIPLVSPHELETTSLSHTEHETIGEFSRTLCLPRKGEPMVEEPSPTIEEILPRSHRYGAASMARANLPVACGNPTATQSIVPGAMPAVQVQSCRGAPSARGPYQQKAWNSEPLVRHASADWSTNAASRASSCRGYPSHQAVSATQGHAYAAHDHLPALRDSVPLPSIRDPMSSAQQSMPYAQPPMPSAQPSKPSIRDIILADRELIPAMRETYSRSSAAENVQYTLTTDPNLAGKRIAWERIELGRLLSRGAFGEVWVCRYAGKSVAVKRLLQSKKPTFNETKIFTNEIRLTASLNHPNIVRFIGVAWSSLENLAMVQEYLPRGDLQKYLQRNGDLMTWTRDKIGMAIGIARAIAYLHSRKVIHRDIKARNVLLTRRLRPKLIDFGTSRLCSPTKMSAGIGTPFWTAPEVLESTEYTEKADIYSFGVLLSEMDTCEAPYHNTLGPDGEKMQTFHILKEVVDGTLRPSLSTDCPERIQKAANACFQHDPKQRPSAVELLELLKG